MNHSIDTAVLSPGIPKEEEPKSPLEQEVNFIIHA